MSRTQTVLVIDDDAMIRRLIPVRLRSLGVRVIAAADGPEGLQRARCDEPDLILLDVNMAGMDGFEVCDRLRSDPVTRDIPVIFLTGSDDPEEKSRGFELGAVDYVTKPFDPAELLARVRAALRTQALVEQLEVQARTDGLTGLLNRQAFTEAVSRRLARSCHAPDYGFAILFLDLDRFKLINDSMGHPIGDELLITVARKLARCVRQPSPHRRGDRVDIVARFGGDEFAILLGGVTDHRQAAEVAERIQKELNQPYILNGYHVTASVSIGIRLSQGASDTAEALLRDSDIAMYRAKSDGRGRPVAFDPAMHEEAVGRIAIEHHLQEAIHRRQFKLWYQPIINLGSGRLYGFEGLIRWDHPQQGLIRPDRFIPVAEETGLIFAISRWVLREACGQLHRWRRSIPAAAAGEPTMTVNLSPLDLDSPDLHRNLASVLRQTNIDPHQLVLEVTESAIMSNRQAVIPVLDKVRRLGVRLAMDDFGTGYSSLALLNQIPIDIIKIDKSFISAMALSRAHAAIVNTIIALADNLEIDVIAEGIETEDQLTRLQAMDCAFGQGHHFSRALPPDRASELLAAQRLRLRA